MPWASSQSPSSSSRSAASSGLSEGALATRSAVRSWISMRPASASRENGPSAITASLCRIFATRSRSDEVARTAAAAGLFSSWVRPADSEPSASSRSRWPMARWVFLEPKNSPSSRCTAIGNHSRMTAAKVSAGSTKNRVGSVTRIELL